MHVLLRLDRLGTSNHTRARYLTRWGKHTVTRASVSQFGTVVCCEGQKPAENPPLPRRIVARRLSVPGGKNKIKFSQSHNNIQSLGIPFFCMDLTLRSTTFDADTPAV